MSGSKGRFVEGCAFCMIARDELSARVVYQDEDVVAFHDISPQAPVHVLVIPRSHYANLSDDVPPGVMTAICAAVPIVATISGIADTGYRVIVNSGRDSNQTIDHLHVHVLGGRRMTHGMLQFSE